MRNMFKKSLVTCILVVAMLLALFSVAFADSPQYIYFENRDFKIVRANYQQAIDDLPEDTTLRNAIRSELMHAIGSFRHVWVECSEGIVINYSKALDDGASYPDAITDLATYQASKPVHDKDIRTGPIADPEPPIVFEELTVHYIDVGQGDSILIQSSSQNVLIDGGNRGSTVVDYLTRTGVDELDLVIGTHPHADHIGGLINVMEAIPVDEVIDPGVVHTTITFENYLDIIDEKDITYTEGRTGMTRDLGGGAELKVVHPESPSSTDLNNASIVVRMTYGDVSFLFTGDAEKEAEAEMLNRDHTLESTILKVGHHGSRTSTTQEFLNTVNPEVAVIMCGQNNAYGHPHEEVLDRLSAADVDIFRTDLHGNIIITATGGYTYQVSTQKEPTSELIITSIEDIADYTADYGTSFNDLLLPEAVEVTYDNDSTDMLNVIWSEEGYDSETSGTYVIKGELVLPENVINYYNFMVKVNVIIKEEVLEQIPITAIAPIIGEAKVGSMLEAGELTPTDATATYQWKIADEADGIFENIPGATSNSYSPVDRDEGYYIKVEATGTGLYTGKVTSVPVGPIVMPEPELPAPGMVNINAASHEELQKIIHIGPARASEIIALRPFNTLDELTRVSGIAETRLRDIKEQGIAYAGPYDETNDEEDEPAPPAPDPPAPGMVNINTASHQELQRIIHIGPVRASEIISLRPFSSVNALTRVSGIGPARLRDIKNQGIAYVD